MPLLAVDLGGTKLALAVFSQQGDLLCEEKVALEKRKGKEVEQLIMDRVAAILDQQTNKGEAIEAIGISIPGIYHKATGTVWAPNIAGWEDYPLLTEIKTVAPDIPVTIESDRSCYIVGEWWKGAAQNCTDAIFLAVGTGIGAGILTGGKILKGANDIAGAVGWMALERPFQSHYSDCGCFESSASGAGMVKLAKRLILEKKDYHGILKERFDVLTCPEIFAALEQKDIVAGEVLQHCIVSWGMAIANLVSLFNPQKILLGGGVFGPAIQFIPAIQCEAAKWAQPLSMKQVSIEASALGPRAGLYGAACIAVQKFKNRACL